MGSDETTTCRQVGEEPEEPCLQHRPVIVLVPFPAQGHVTPMLHLAVALRRHGFHPVLVLPASIYRRLLSTSQSGGPDVDDGREVMLAPLPDGLAEGTQGDFFALERAMEDVMPAHLEGLLRSLDSGPAGGRVACVLVDLLASWAIGVAARCMVPVAGFWPAMLATYRLVSAASDLVGRGLISPSGIPLGDGAAIAVTDALPSCAPTLSTGDLPWLVGDLASQKARFAFWRRTLDRSRPLRWLIVNTFSGEGCRGSGVPDNRRHPCTVSASPAGPRIYQVGPLAAKSFGGGNESGGGLSFWEEDGSCMKWLEAQRPGSVVYVSFGSWVGPIGEGSLGELALGLEATRRPFLWVLGDSWRAGLPVGYLDRVVGRGKLVRWAPQREVLRHAAVGCYLTHCGWNSTMEAVQCKKRLLCYPVAGDQFINCRYIVGVWGIGVRLDGMRRAAVEEGVQRVMGAEGETLQSRVKEMRVEVTGEEARARAAAELVAFVEDLKGSRGVGGGHDQWLLQPRNVRERELPSVWAKGVACSTD